MSWIVIQGPIITNSTTDADRSAYRVRRICEDSTTVNTPGDIIAAMRYYAEGQLALSHNERRSFLRIIAGRRKDLDLTVEKPRQKRLSIPRVERAAAQGQVLAL